MGNVKLSNERIGAVGKNKYDSVYTVINYKTYSDIVVKFETGEEVHTSWNNFKNGSIRSVYDKTIYGVGYFGEGKYVAKINDKITPQYDTWRGMIKRCYIKNEEIQYRSYKEVTVDPIWHNFQNFAKWYDENYYEVGQERMCLDKDILIKGNKIYSPDTCVFVPQRVNKLFIKQQFKRGNLPMGVGWHKEYKKYSAVCDGKHISWHDNSNEAFQAYKLYKEHLIKQVAEEYKDKIPNELYKALCNYEVEITD